MSSFLPPSFNSALFNSNAFAGSTYITKIQADLLYLNTASGKNLYMLDVVPGTTQASRALVYNSSGSLDQVKVSRNSGDCLSIACTDGNGRSTLLCSAPGSTLEVGVRGNAASSYPSSYYRYSNGAYRYIMDTASGDSQQFGRSVIDTSGSHLSLKNGSNTSFLEETASNILRIVSGLSLNLDSSGLRLDTLATTSAARSKIDLGAAATDRGIALFNNTASYFGISANNNALQYQSNVNHLWTTGCTDASPLGTTVMSMNNTGSLTCYDNTVMKKGFFIERQAFSSTGRSGRGISAFYANSDSVAKLFAYNYGTSSFEGLQLGNCMLVDGSGGGRVTIDNGVSSSGSYPLTVTSWFSTSFAGSYGYIGVGGAGTGVGTGVVDVSIYANKRIWCQETDSFSDVRLKENIKELSEDDCIDFVRNVKSVSFNWKSDKEKKRSVGYIAQDLLKHNKFNELVSLGPDKDLEELVEEVDGRRFVSPAGQRFSVNYSGAIPVLHSALASAFDLIEDLQDRLDSLEKKNKK